LIDDIGKQFGAVPYFPDEKYIKPDQLVIKTIHIHPTPIKKHLWLILKWTVNSLIAIVVITLVIAIG